MSALPLVEAIRREIGAWPEAHVELAVYGTRDPAAIAAEVERFCSRRLGASVAGGRFYRASVGSVCGLDLDDGRVVVVKAHQPSEPPSALAAAAAVRRELSLRGFPCPRPLAGPFPLGRGHAVCDELIDAGEVADAHEPWARLLMAQTLAQLLRHGPALRELPEVRGAPARRLRPPSGRLWPTPHSRLFDFEATAAGAGWIDAARARACAVLAAPAGEVVVGHGDWSAKHLRFARGRVSAVYDWDLALDAEPVFAGAAAACFTATWELPVRLAPSPAESAAFLDEYEQARGAPLSGAERRTAAAAALALVAYTARCEHALAPRQDDPPADSFRRLLRDCEEELVERLAGAGAV